MKNKNKFTPDQNLKLMDQVRQVMRYFHYAYRTEQPLIVIGFFDTLNFIVQGKWVKKK